MAYLTTKTGEKVLVDDDLYGELSKYRWFMHNGGYVIRNCRNGGTRYLHRLVNQTPKGKYTDHINRNKLDNRRGNLRTCNASENQRNSRKPAGAIPYRGVTFDERKVKYQARIKINGVHKHIGLFDTAWEAAVAYNIFARMYHGEFAILNIVEDVPEVDKNDFSYKSKVKAFIHNQT